MITAADLYQIISTLPEAEECFTWGSVTFRVQNKIFAVIHPSEQRVTVKARKSQQAALLATDPETYTPAPYTGRFGWVSVQLSSVHSDELHELIVEAWRHTAPERIVTIYDLRKNL